jgi:hypothetical protein
MRKTPREKKLLSYAKDCRTTYGENDKASRKYIRLRKAGVNRGYRRRINQYLQEINKSTDLDKTNASESCIRSVKRKYGKKLGDEPLGRVVEQKLERRNTHAGNGKTARKKVREFVANLRIQLEQETDGRWIAEAEDMNGVLVYGETPEAASESCRRFAGFVFLENIGAIGEVTVNETYISIVTY